MVAEGFYPTCPRFGVVMQLKCGIKITFKRELRGLCLSYIPYTDIGYWIYYWVSRSSVHSGLLLNLYIKKQCMPFVSGLTLKFNNHKIRNNVRRNCQLTLHKKKEGEGIRLAMKKSQSQSQTGNISRKSAASTLPAILTSHKSFQHYY